MVSRAGSVNPDHFPDETFDLYSIPAYDAGEPELAQGKDIGSAKQVVAPGDVLLSKIVPHIRRAWIVGESRGHRLIASGEWIVFRGRFHGPYLRHVLMGDAFHQQFMNTVAGVGGSLLRARPAFVKEIEIPLPPVEEQRRIADILDRADALRAKRRESLALLDDLTQSIFSDVLDESRDLQPVAFTNAFWMQEGPGVRKWQFRDSGIKLLNVANILPSGDLDLAKTSRYLDRLEVEQRYQHFLADEGDLVIASSGISFGADGLLKTRGAFVRSEHLPLCMNTSTVRFKPLGDHASLRFLKAWLNSLEFRRQITRLVTGSAQQNFGPSHLRQLHITLPPMDVQEELVRRLVCVELLRESLLQQSRELDSLHASLEQRAFAGLL
jgi:type I restriction enzyme S subunit